MASSHYVSFFLIVTPLVLSIFIGICFAENGQKTVGNWLEIASPDDPVVIEVGQFAVNQNNNDTNSTLEFQRVVKGDTQIVGGINWRLTIEVKDDNSTTNSTTNSTKNCEAYVYEQPWQNVRKLISFKII